MKLKNLVAVPNYKGYFINKKSKEVISFKGVFPKVLSTNNQGWVGLFKSGKQTFFSPEQIENIISDNCKK